MSDLITRDDELVSSSFPRMNTGLHKILLAEPVPIEMRLRMQPANKLARSETSDPAVDETLAVIKGKCFIP